MGLIGINTIPNTSIVSKSNKTAECKVTLPHCLIKHHHEDAQGSGGIDACILNLSTRSRLLYVFSIHYSV